MIIGEHHPYKLINGELHRKCYRDKWVAVKGKPLDWRYYDGQERDEKRAVAIVHHFYKISIRS